MTGSGFHVVKNIKNNNKGPVLFDSTDNYVMKPKMLPLTYLI